MLLEDAKCYEDSKLRKFVSTDDREPFEWQPIGPDRLFETCAVACQESCWEVKLHEVLRGKSFFTKKAVNGEWRQPSGRMRFYFGSFTPEK